MNIEEENADILRDLRTFEIMAHRKMNLAQELRYYGHVKCQWLRKNVKVVVQGRRRMGLMQGGHRTFMTSWGKWFKIQTTTCFLGSPRRVVFHKNLFNEKEASTSWFLIYALVRALVVT